MKTMQATVSVQLEVKPDDLERVLNEEVNELIRRLEATVGGFPNGIKPGSVKVKVIDKKIA
jgi:hypothetical protein